MASSGKPNDTQPFGIHTELSGMRPDVLNGSGGVLMRCRVMVTGPETVFQDKPSHPVLVQPLNDLFALMVHCQTAVTAPWADENSGAGVVFLRGKMDGKCGLVLILLPHGSGRTFRPEQNGVGVLTTCSGEH